MMLKRKHKSVVSFVKIVVASDVRGRGKWKILRHRVPFQASNAALSKEKRNQSLPIFGIVLKLS